MSKNTSIEMLLSRQSTSLLTEPAPNKQDLDTILNTGIRVPDHASLKPWHFTVISGAGLQRLSDLFFDVAKADNLLAAKQEKMRKAPFRAPMIIVVSTKFVEHEKVPKQEQLITAGCCVHAMQMAAFSLGYGAMWRTGTMAYHDKVKQGLKIALTDELVGFLYIGTPTKALVTKASKSVLSEVDFW